MEAFQHAVDLGFRYVETDVQVSSDGVLAAFHDDDLERTCGIDRKISEMPWSEVAEARVDGKAPIPTLDELLGTWPELRVNIDCKTDRAVPALISAIQRTGSIDRICVGSFSDRRVRLLRRELGPRLCTALGPAGVVNLRYGIFIAKPAATAQIPVRQGRLLVVNERLINHANRLGVRVHVWTIDDPAEMHRLLDLGVHGIMTDKPAVLRDVWRERGIWID